MKIAFISPYKELIEMVTRILKEINIPVDVYEGAFEKGAKLAKKLEKEGYDIIISRGATYSLITNSVNIPVVNCGVTSFDILYAVEEARKLSRKIGLILYEPVSFNSQSLAEIFNIELLHLTSYKYSAEAISLVEEAVNKGVEVIIGGILTKQHVESLGRKGVLLKTAEETVVQAIQNAAEIVALSRQRILETERMKQIINFAYDGIIVTNENGVVQVFNPAAERIMGIEAQDIVGNHTEELIPSTGIMKVLTTGEQQIGEIQQHKGNTIITNRVPIKIKNKVEGVVTTFQEVAHIQNVEMKIRSEIYKKGLVAKYTLEQYIGKSQSVKSLIAKAKKFAVSDSTILIHGESGTGKEILAQGIHNASARKNYPFVAVNCSAIPEHLLESEIFGYDEGAFTGAKKGGKMGLFELAHRGTIFLDEIGSISQSLQASLLRVLQEKEVWRVGSNRVIQIDVRVIAATNNDLFELAQKGQFRRDLYYRLNVLRLQTKPLRERQEDIEELLDYFMSKTLYNMNQKLKDKLKAYYWPGNVRELENFIERVSLLGEEMSMEEIFEDLIEPYEGVDEIELPKNQKEWILLKQQSMKEMEKEIILEVYKKCGENMTMTAEQLGISRTTLWKKLREIE